MGKLYKVFTIRYESGKFVLLHLVMSACISSVRSRSKFYCITVSLLFIIDWCGKQLCSAFCVLWLVAAGHTSLALHTVCIHAQMPPNYSSIFYIFLGVASHRLFTKKNKQTKKLVSLETVQDASEDELLGNGLKIIYTDE